MVIFRLESLDTDKILTSFLFNIEIYYVLFLVFLEITIFLLLCHCYKIYFIISLITTLRQESLKGL